MEYIDEPGSNTEFRQRIMIVLHAAILSLCEISDIPGINCQILDSKTLVVEKFKRRMYYTRLFYTENFEDYYIITDYMVSQQDILNYRTFCEVNTILPNDILEVICLQMFGYRNISFLDTVDRKHWIRVLLMRYIIDGKCMFGKRISDANASIQILRGNPIDKSLDIHTRSKLQAEQDLIDTIRNYYSGKIPAPRVIPEICQESDAFVVDIMHQLYPEALSSK